MEAGGQPNGRPSIGEGIANLPLGAQYGSGDSRPQGGELTGYRAHEHEP